MTLPLKTGGTTVTILDMVENALGDKTWTDGKTVQGCMFFPSFSTTGRVSLRSEQTAGGSDVVNASRTLYMPFDTKVGPTSRVLIHPPGIDDIEDVDAKARREGTYDVLGEPMFWRNQLTGWAPCCEVALVRIY